MGNKRLSEIMGLEIINVNNGEKYGYIGDCDINFDSVSGEIISLSVKEGKKSLFSMKDEKCINIPWIKKIKQGDKTIIFDYEI